ncbi:MAG: PEP-CTERM sorting domain-containing protein [Chthoniobacter sp.]|nr:PEP-CTERM sorting domain-containing protein [Chthoniobacter sp.]
MNKHFILSSTILAGAALLSLTPSLKAQSTITAWTFQNDAVATNNNPAPSTGSGTASSIGMNLYATPNVGVTTDDVLVGKSADTGANGVADITNTWRVRAQAGSNGAANGWSSAAPIGTQGAVFAASTVGFTGINVSFDWYSTTQGEANLQLQYTTNGTTWINQAVTLAGSDAGAVVLTNSSSANTVSGSYVSDNLLNNGSSAGQDWFTGLTATITDPAAANNANFAIELVNASTGADAVSTQGTALNNSSGNWRFDNVSINGTAVPEPTTGAALLGGLGILLGFRKVRRGSLKN